MKIAIIGAGIGGLTLALMAERQGFEVEVWEAVQTLRPLGVGINLLPHAARQLCELGLEDTLSALAIRTSALAYYNRFGQHSGSSHRHWYYRPSRSCRTLGWRV